MSPKLSFNWMSSLKFHNELSQQMLVSMTLLNRNWCTGVGYYRSCGMFGTLLSSRCFGCFCGSGFNARRRRRRWRRRRRRCGSCRPGRWTLCRRQRRHVQRRVVWSDAFILLNEKIVIGKARQLFGLAKLVPASSNYLATVHVQSSIKYGTRLIYNYVERIISCKVPQCGGPRDVQEIANRTATLLFQLTSCSKKSAVVHSEIVIK